MQKVILLVFENGDSEIMDMHHAGSDVLEAKYEHKSSEAANRKLEERLISDSCASDHLFDNVEEICDKRKLYEILFYLFLFLIYSTLT
jgi:hypothetical protein